MNWEHALRDYQHYLRLERGLSDNSITNYSLDVRKLMRFLNVNNISISPEKIDHQTLQQFVYEASKSLNARSQSRLISGLKSFFQLPVI